jgi:hypothetical protein
MRKSVCFVLVAFILGACGIVGCASNKAATKAEYASHLADYQRLAIVCIPGSGADPAYASSILKEVQKMVPTRLNFLKKVDCLNDVPVDALVTPPRVSLSNAADYDAVVVLVYSYSGGAVDLNMTMEDSKTGQVLWTHKLSTRDGDTFGRLLKHGYWTPTTIKMSFYGQ